MKISFFSSNDQPSRLEDKSNIDQKHKYRQAMRILLNRKVNWGIKPSVYQAILKLEDHTLGRATSL